MERFTASWLQDYFDIVDAVIAEGQKSRALRPELPRKLVVKAFFGALDEMVTSWVLSHKGYDLAALADPVVELFLNGAASATQRAELGVVAGAAR